MDIYHPCHPSKSLARHIDPGSVGDAPHPVIANLLDADQRGRERGNEDGHRYIGTAYTCAHLSLWSAASIAQHAAREA